MRILTSYLSKRFLRVFGAVLASATLLITAVSLVELLRRVSRGQEASGTISSAQLLSLAQRVLETVFELVPILLLASTVYALTTLGRSSAYKVLRISGATLMSILQPHILIAFAILVVCVGMLNPLTAHIAQRHSKHELQGTASVAITGQRVWVVDQVESGNVLVVSSDRARFGQDTAVLDNANVLFTESGTQTNVKTVTLGNGVWTLDADKTIKTNLQPSALLKRFTVPEQLSVLQLPGFIAALDQQHLPSHKHKTHLAKLLVQPFVSISMIACAALVALSQISRRRFVLLISCAFLASYVLNKVALSYVLNMMPNPLASAMFIVFVLQVLTACVLFWRRR